MQLEVYLTVYPNASTYPNQFTLEITIKVTIKGSDSLKHTHGIGGLLTAMTKQETRPEHPAYIFNC